MQTTIDFAQDRVRIKRGLGATEIAVRRVLTEYPELRSVKRRNDFVRKVWALYGDYPLESITRIARRLQAQGFFDTIENQEVRSNIECSYRQYFNNQIA